TARAMLLQPLQPYTEPVIGEAVTGSPAARAGLESGDRVVSVGGQPIETWNEFGNLVRASPSEPLPLIVERGGGRVELTAIPDSERELDAEMRRVEIGRIGVGVEQQVEYRRLGPGDALTFGVTTTWGMSRMIVGFVGDLFT